MRNTAIRWIPRVLAILALSAPGAEPIELVPRSEFAYQPRNESEYMQAWNVNYHGPELRIYATFVVSNFGPGDRNNGVSVLVVKDGVSRAWTAEYTDSNFGGTPGQFGIKTENDQLHYANGAYHAKIWVRDELDIELALQPLAGGVRLSGGRLRVSGNPEEFIRADIPLAAARATGRIRIDGADIALSGVGGMEYLSMNASPHRYAKRLRLTRTYTGGRGVFLAQLYGTGSFPGGRFGAIAIMEGGRIVVGETLSDWTDSAEQIDAASGYSIPQRSVFRSQTCTASESLGRNVGQYSILENISALLRWVIRVLFTRPYTLHYESRVEVDCNGTKQSFNAITSWYMINR
jgi:hypothetical protein